MQCKGPRTFKTISEMQNNVGGLILPDFKTTIIKTLLCQHRDRQIDQWNITETRIGPKIYGKPICDNSAKAMQWRKQFSEQMAIEWLDIHK